MSKEIVKKYANGEITVKWQSGLCIHSANCVKGLPEVFDADKKPWINMHGADSDNIIQQVHRCPSGALSIEGREKVQDIRLAEESIVADEKPVVLELEQHKNYAWCACGRSSNQPWCDGSHKVTSIKPVVFKSETNAKNAMCMCKQSANKPFCDGTHNRLVK